MSIRILNSENIPALVYDRLFLEKLDLTQKRDDDDLNQPYYTLNITYRLFAVDANNKRNYKNKTNTLTITDYFSEAMIKASGGDMDLINAAGAIELALAKIIEDQTDLGISEVF